MTKNIEQQVNQHICCGAIAELQLMAINCEIEFNIVLQILKNKRYRVLYEQVFCDEFVAKLDNTHWAALLLQSIYHKDLCRFDRQFVSKRFFILNKQTQTKLARLCCLRFGFAREQLQTMFRLGASVDDAMLNTIKPSHPNFDLVLAYADLNLVSSWLNKQLRKALNKLKHPANYSARAKVSLNKGYGWWSDDPKMVLSEFRVLYLLYGAKVPLHTADWLLLAVLTEDYLLFKGYCMGCDTFTQKASNGMLPLVEAAGRHNHYWAVKELLEHGADPNQRDGNGFSALFAALAREDCSESIISLLLEYGADPSYRDFSHSTLLWSLKKNLPIHIRQRLEKAGAQEYPAYRPTIQFCGYQNLELTKTIHELSK
ncbi:hypothetical protein FCV43_12230 [Vibrio genomosp. F6]|uniref:ankyrin repeat domain-containing protein n=1 Tax=Vibrio genomosp. F6 TaxID=723172 RepID=UPI0010BDA2E3|nr:ankyrin repeat domain-containing protein [Vibrio genomosp. F6]TKF21162.1 hypothetical protein FCV43_12230 [Vibrio genomosp. F6]